MSLFGVDPREIEDAIKRIFGGNGGGAVLPDSPDDAAPNPGANQPDGSWYRPFDAGALPSSTADLAGPAQQPATDFFARSATARQAPVVGQPLAGSLAAGAGEGAAPGAGPARPGIIYDMSITHQLEGTGSNPLVPYVLPPERFPLSGATIGHGIDLSRLTASDLRQMHMSEQFIAQVSPFLAPEPSGAKGSKPVYGPTGAAARDLDRKLLDPADIDALQRAVDDRMVTRTRKAYDRANPTTSFDDLDPAHRTALIDMGFNRGPRFGYRKDGRYKDLWGDITAGNWDSAAARLENDNGPYAARSRQQACIIRTGAPCPSPKR